MRRALMMLVLCLVGCRGGEPLRVGAKAFDEQRVLAAMIAGLVTSELSEPARVQECGDTYACQRMLRSGELDILVEYSGTARALSGAPPDGPTDAVYRALDLEAVASLGFGNGYALVVPTPVAERHGLRAISDLTRRGEPLTFGAPSTYLGRPRDGLPSLLRRYGLRSSGPAEVLDEPLARYHALARGRIDVAIGYETDAALDEPGLTVLADDLGFFGAYEAEVVVRRATLERIDGLRGALSRLDDRVDQGSMRALVAEVQQAGHPPDLVARRFLSQRGIADVVQREGGGVALPIAVHPADSLPGERRRAVAAARRAFPDRPTPLRDTRDLGGTLADGRARLAVLGAERFFASDGSALPLRDERLSALAVLGTRAVHRVRRAPGDRVGAPPLGSGAAILADAVLESTPEARGEATELLDRLARGELDVAIVVGALPQPDVTRALREHPELTLEPVDAPPTPMLRALQIPPGTYAGQLGAVRTVGAQVLLTGASPSTRAEQVVGPAAALRVGGHPLSNAERDRLRDALGDAELPDPALPSPWSLTDAPTEPGSEVGAAAFDTVATLLTLAFLGWLAFLLVQPLRARRT